MSRIPTAILLLAAALLLGARPGDAPEPEPSAPPSDALRPPTIEDLGYFLSRLDEWKKGEALNILMDLAADSRLDRRDKIEVMNRLLDEGSPPEEFGYGCPTCFQKRLSGLLEPLRMQGPRVAGPKDGVLVIPVNDRLVKKLTREGKARAGESLPTFVKALLDGYDPTADWTPWAYARYHGKGAETRSEPVFFSSAAALAEHEANLGEPLDAYSLARFLCVDPPRNRYEPGFLVLQFEVTRVCNEVRIPTAGDCEEASFRPTPQSETEAGRTCGGAPEWVCPNFPLSAVSSVRFVGNDSYVKGMR
jgi:hypothetical protein